MAPRANNHWIRKLADRIQSPPTLCLRRFPIGHDKHGQAWILPAAVALEGGHTCPVLASFEHGKQPIRSPTLYFVFQRSGWRPKQWSSTFAEQQHGLGPR